MNPNFPNNQQMPPMMTPEQYMQWYNQMMQMQQQPMQQMTQAQMQAQTQYMGQMPQQTMPVQQVAPVNPVAAQPMMVNGQMNPAVMQRDPNVMAFMMEAVREKNKDTGVTPEFIQSETERLYDEFGEKLVENFEPMLSDEQIKTFDQVLQNGGTQENLLEFLKGCIPNLEMRIQEFLVTYKTRYLES